MNEYHKKIIEEKEKWRELERLEREKDKLTFELSNLRQKETEYKQKLMDERIDVEKLEGFSIAGVFMSLVGKKEERLDKERQEVTLAHLKWEEAKQARLEVENELHRLTNRITELGNPEGNYKNLLLEKQNDLININRVEGQQAFDLLNDIADLKADIKEIKEAEEAGTLALNALDSAKESLQKAKNWGTVDMFGGGLISTSIKHSNMDSAKDEVHRAQSLLRKFSHELDDIGHTFQVDLSLSGGLTFMDYFFDGLLSDWLVQDKINQSYEQVQKMYNETNKTLQKLKHLLSQTEETIYSFEEKWEKLVELA